MDKRKPLLNTIAFLLMIVANYYANTGAIHGETMGSVSEQYQNLFTPAGYAFSIWGLIYLGLGGFIVFQWLPGKGSLIANKVGYWFVISCILNISWIFAWLFHLTGLSVVIMFMLLFCLIRIIIQTEMELHDEPLSVIVLHWWPFSFYSGWISVALIANIAAWLTAMGWQGFGISEVTWTVALILVAMVINLVITWTRNMREFALVGAWGLLAVGLANQYVQESIFFTACSAAGVLLISSAIHGYRNRDYAPWKKL